MKLKRNKKPRTSDANGADGSFLGTHGKYTDSLTRCLNRSAKWRYDMRFSSARNAVNSSGSVTSIKRGFGPLASVLHE